MKHMLLSIFSSLYLTVFGQITVTSSTFPSAGDTLKYALDESSNPAGAITPPGGGQYWDFSNLKFDETFNTVYLNASAGTQAAAFPGASLVTIGQQGETYYRKSSSKFEVLGYAGSDPANIGLNVVTKFQPPVVMRRSPMNFFDINLVETNLSLPFAVGDIPGGIIPPIPFVDSIRFRINYKRTDLVDGFGKVSIPGGLYNVLRERRTEYTTTNLDVRTPLGWTPIGGGGGGGIFNFLGVDTVVTHRFVSGTEKEDIVVLTLNSTGTAIDFITFKNMLGTSSTDDAPKSPLRPSVQAYPNPAVESVSFFCYSLPPSDYTLKIFNIVGRTVFQTVESIHGDRVIIVDLEDFKKGPYLYSFTDAEGRIIATKRLVVLKP